MKSFKAEIALIGINPYVLVPNSILQEIFKSAGKEKGPIPIRGTVNRKPYMQTLMKFRGVWRLYINMEMLKDSPKRIGETIEVMIEFDAADRTITPHPKLIAALQADQTAKKVFDTLSPSIRKEIVRYISHLKMEVSIDKNVDRAINFLNGKERFIGRDKP